MPAPPKKKGRQAKGERAGARRKGPTPVVGKEYNYVLQLGEDDAALLQRYRDVLVQGAAGFAQTTYNYLFDNPDIADVMYAYERGGGDVGALVRGQFEHLLKLLGGNLDEAGGLASEKVGRSHFHHGVKPVWSLGAYRLFLDHLQQLVASDPQIDHTDRDALESALVKVVFRDIGITTEAYWREAVEQLTEQRDVLDKEQNLADELLGNIPQMLWTVDIEANRISYASPGTLKFCGGELEAPIPCFYRINGAQRERVLTAWQQVIDGNPVQLEVQVDLQDGDDHWFRLALYPVANRRGRVLRVHCLMEDVTELHSDRQKLEQLSTTDEVTGLANRTLWYDRLSSALAVARRNPGASVAVMMLDINQFKVYNESLGHQGGDQLLRRIARRLAKVVRDSDTLARLGGDEFGVVLPLVQDVETAAERVARQVIASLAEPLVLGDKELCVSASIGIALYPQHGEDPHSLASHADSAMYRAKWNSVPFLFYEADTMVSAREHLQFSGQLHGALERDEFELLYQPKVDMESGRICGAEALLRWQHPQQGVVMPKRFVPVAEQLGMITPITDWVLTHALQESRNWQGDGVRVPVAINVSGRSFQAPGLLERIEQALQEAGVPGNQLEIEITEDTLMADPGEGARILERLRELGVSVAIDDFGTGCSSLASLKGLPISTLKIDQSFLSQMESDPEDAAIVRSIIELGHNLGCTVVAEGVENQAVLDQLRSLGCDLVQGYHISRPLDVAGFGHWLSQTH